MERFVHERLDTFVVVRKCLRCIDNKSSAISGYRIAEVLGTISVWYP